MNQFPYIKSDFPIFLHNPDLTYLDSTATSLKPTSVIKKLQEYYEHYSANIHRGIYKISEKATAEYEETRKVVAQFINANTSSEIIFTRSTTESLNLVASTLGNQIIQEGDEIITSIMEHHSNFVPWQQLALYKKAKLVIIPINENGQLDSIEKYITSRTKIITLTYISNILGTVNPLKEIFAQAKKINQEIITVVDAAQAAPHIPLDVQELGCDFLAFSSHKMLGPTGVGVLWGKYELLEKMPPYQFGGEMVLDVSLDTTTYKKPPHKFEAGTPHVGGVIALKEALNYLSHIGMKKVRQHEKNITQYALDRLTEEFGDTIHILGPDDVEKRGGIISFHFHSFHAHDIAQILDDHNIAIRAGYHCGMPLHTYLQIPATARVSFYIYNEEKDIDTLVEGLKNVKKILGKN